MRAVIVYDYDEMKRVGQLLELVTVKGMDGVNALHEIGKILDSGNPQKIEEENEEKENNK